MSVPLNNLERHFLTVSTLRDGMALRNTMYQEYQVLHVRAILN